MRDRRGCADVAVVGTSAGAASSILAAAADPTLVSCVVAENPFARADTLLIHHCSNALENYLSQNTRHNVRGVVFWLASRILLARMGMFFRSYGPVDVVTALACPLLVAHSTADDVVPFAHGRAIYERAMEANRKDPDRVQFFEVKDAAHCALFDKNPEEWTSVVLPFVMDSFRESIVRG
jgi:dipeptidyl aminopeptidase/acylaminoacyl peptidase